LLCLHNVIEEQLRQYELQLDKLKLYAGLSVVYILSKLLQERSHLNNGIGRQKQLLNGIVDPQLSWVDANFSL
jgi:hypothetical protein